MFLNIKKTIIFLLVLFFTTVPFCNTQAKETYPRTANIYLKSPITNSQVYEFAKWDVLIFHMLAQQNSASAIKKIRQLNPDVKILVYIASEEFPISMYDKWDPYPGTGLFYKLLSGIKDDMWLRDQSGKHVSFWLDFWMLNVSDYPGASYRWSDYLSDFVVDELLSSGLWDGVFYDNTWTGIHWINNGNIDIDADGKVDSKDEIDSDWRIGMKKLFELTRQKAGDDVIIVGNGDRGYDDVVNGLYMENFTDSNNAYWSEKMRLYSLITDSLEPTIAIIGNTNLNDLSSANYQRMRFGLSSSLLEDGYYAFDAGSNSHSELWWYDEYDVDLGEALGESKSKNNYKTYEPDIWQRDFSNGIALVNSTAGTKTIELGGDYEKIRGTQDPEVNDGSIISETSIDGYDGLILLKTLASLSDVVFRNGDFVRFLDSNGNRTRNGFFVFEEGYKGGDKVAHIDLDNNGKRDLLVVNRNKIMAWRDDGQVFMKVYPYTTNYRGELRVAIGDLNADGYCEIYVAPSDGYPMPLKVYTRHGRKMRNDFYPFGENYAGGFYLGTGNIDGGPYKTEELLIGAGKNSQPKVNIYDFNLDKLDEWLAWEYWFSGGVPVTGGDVNGDGVDEIIVGAGPGKKPVVKIFDKSGTQLYDEITIYSSFDTPGIEVISADVDYDGMDDIVGMSGGF